MKAQKNAQSSRHYDQKGSVNERANSNILREPCEKILCEQADKRIMGRKLPLAAAEKNLVKSHKLVLSEQRKEIRRERTALNRSKKQLDKELAKGNEMAASECAVRVARQQAELKNDKIALSRARIDMNENLLAVNKEIKKSDGQFVGVIVVENTVARVDNWITDKTK